MLKKHYRVSIDMVNKIAETYNKPKGDVLTDILNAESQIFHQEQSKHYTEFTKTYYLCAYGRVIDKYKKLNNLSTYM